MSSANFRAKSHFQVRTSVRNFIFRCPPSRCPPLGPPEQSCPSRRCGVATESPYGLLFGDRKGTTKNVTKILPNVRMNFLVQFASKPLCYWVMTGNSLELFRKFFGAVRAIFWLCESFLAPDLFRREFCRVMHVRVASGVDTEFPYRVRIVDRGVDCHDPVCRRKNAIFLEQNKTDGIELCVHSDTLFRPRALRTPRPATEPRDGPSRNFHEKYRKNTPRAEILEPQENTEKIPKKYQKCVFLVFWGYFFGIFGVFWG